MIITNQNNELNPLPAYILDVVFNSPLHDLAISTAKSAHFPKISTLATFFGVYSNILVNRGVTVEHDGAIFPAGLYMIVTGDPGTGKSLVLKKPSLAANTAYKELNKIRASNRRKLDRKISNLTKQLEELDPFSDESKTDELDKQIAALLAKKQANFEYMLGLSDATPAATNQLALSSGGVVNYCSAEPDLFFSLFNTSGDKGADKSMLLHGFDGGETNTYRVSRKGYRGTVKSGLICMAQPSALHDLIREQNDGRGVIERFLLVDEDQPKRDLTKRHSIPQNVLDSWEQLVRKTAGIYQKGICTAPIHLVISDIDDNRIINTSQEVEDQIDAGARFSSTLMKSVGRKCRHQIAKLAAVLYMAKTQANVRTPLNDDGEIRTISSDCITAAIGYWWAFIAMFEQVATETGTGGQVAVMDALAAMLRRHCGRGKTQSLSYLANAASKQRKGHILKAYSKKADMEKLLKKAEELGWITQENSNYSIKLNS